VRDEPEESGPEGMLRGPQSAKGKGTGKRGKRGKKRKGRKHGRY
jgi:hypothetical protein